MATRQRGALGEIRTTRAQQLRNKMIQKNQEAKIPAKRPLTGTFLFLTRGPQPSWTFETLFSVLARYDNQEFHDGNDFEQTFMDFTLIFSLMEVW